MNIIQYETAGGIKRTFEYVGKAVVSDNKLRTTYKGANGKTYTWEQQACTNYSTLRIEPDVIFVSTRTGFKRLGTQARYITNA